ESLGSVTTIGLLAGGFELKALLQRACSIVARALIATRLIKRCRAPLNTSLDGSTFLMALLDLWARVDRGLPRVRLDVPLDGYGMPGVVRRNDQHDVDGQHTCVGNPDRAGFSLSPVAVIEHLIDVNYICLWTTTILAGRHQVELHETSSA
ncbi:MAG: hypothetical protein ACRELY_04360, partial [Polyangiaceae bacterium]